MGLFGDLLTAPFRVAASVATLPLDVASKVAEVASDGDNDELERIAKRIRDSVNETCDEVTGS